MLTNAEKVIIVLKMGFSCLRINLNLLGGERCYSRLTLKQSVYTVLSQTFFTHKICFKHAIH